MKENRLWYNTPAADWNSALPLGNGILGMMVFGGYTEEHIQLNEETFWSGYAGVDSDDPRTYEHLEEMRRLIFEGKYTQAQKLCDQYMVCQGLGTHDSTGAYGSLQTAGDIYITSLQDAHDSYRRELYLDDGRAVVRSADTCRNFCISYTYNTAVIKLNGCTQDTKIRYERENASVIYRDGEIIAAGFLPTRYAVLIRYVLQDGCLVCYITAATAYKSELDPLTVCQQTLDKAMAAGTEALFLDAKEYFSTLLGRVSITFPQSGSKSEIPTDQRLKQPVNDLGLVELYFNFGRYLLAASSRGKLPATLQGIWCNDYVAPWNSDFHLNINAQMNYWPAEVCDLAECMEPFFNLVELIAEKGTKTARKLYNCPGWVVHFATNPWGFTALGTDPLWGAFVTAGAWCLRHIKERWLYSNDDTILQKYYSIIRGSSEFFCSYLVRDPRNGYMVTVPASSPENSFLSPEDGTRVCICAAPTMDTSIIRELLEFNLEAAEIVGETDEFKQQLNEALAGLTPLQIGKHGQIMEWSEDFEEFEPGHRHMSHLYGLFPAAEIRQSTPVLFEAARRTLERRLSHGGGHTGWSRAWIINLWARLTEGNAAYENICALLEHSTFPNMFDAHPPFQIDGNFGGTSGIAEMLLQSHDGYIDLLPALPDAWKDGSFEGLMARGGYKVSCTWKNSFVEHCHVTGPDGKEFRLKINGTMVDAVGAYIL